MWSLVEIGPVIWEEMLFEEIVDADGCWRTIDDGHQAVTKSNAWQFTVIHKLISNVVQVMTSRVNFPHFSETNLIIKSINLQEPLFSKVHAYHNCSIILIVSQCFYADSFTKKTIECYHTSIVVLWFPDNFGFPSVVLDKTALFTRIQSPTAIWADASLLQNAKGIAPFSSPKTPFLTSVSAPYDVVTVLTSSAWKSLRLNI